MLLIDFWAAWCGPCRRENPNVVKVYKEFSKKGFDVFGVSLDQKKDDWVKAISDDKLTWTHVSDLKYWENAAARLYAVYSIPANFLLDEKGVIIARNLRGDELYNKVKGNAWRAIGFYYSPFLNSSPGFTSSRMNPVPLTVRISMFLSSVMYFLSREIKTSMLLPRKVVILTPDLGQNVFSCQDLIFVDYEVLQKLSFLKGKLFLRIAAEEFEGIELQNCV